MLSDCWVWIFNQIQSTGWWFEIFFIFIPIWGNDPNLLIFFRWVETTNQNPINLIQSFCLLWAPRPGGKGAFLIRPLDMLNLTMPWTNESFPKGWRATTSYCPECVGTLPKWSKHFSQRWNGDHPKEEATYLIQICPCCRRCSDVCGTYISTISDHINNVKVTDFTMLAMKEYIAPQPLETKIIMVLFNGENPVNHAIRWISIPNELIMNCYSNCCMIFLRQQYQYRLHFQTWQKIFWCHALSLKHGSGMPLGNIEVDAFICLKFQGYWNLLKHPNPDQYMAKLWKDVPLLTQQLCTHRGRRPGRLPRGFAWCQCTISIGSLSGTPGQATPGGLVTIQPSRQPKFGDPCDAIQQWHFNRSN